MWYIWYVLLKRVKFCNETIFKLFLYKCDLNLIYNVITIFYGDAKQPADKVKVQLVCTFLMIIFCTCGIVWKQR